MGFTQIVYEFEGDTTQALAPFLWRTREFLWDHRPGTLYGAIQFDQGDLADFEQALKDYQAIITANRLLISSGTLFPGPALPSGSGFQIGNRSITGTLLTDPGPIPTYAGDLTLTLRVYVDGVLRVTKTVASPKPFRLAAKKRGRAWAFEIEGNVDRVKRMDFASSMEELKAAINE